MTRLRRRFLEHGRFGLDHLFHHRSHGFGRGRLCDLRPARRDPVVLSRERVVIADLHTNIWLNRILVRRKQFFEFRLLLEEDSRWLPTGTRYGILEHPGVKTTSESTSPIALTVAAKISSRSSPDSVSAVSTNEVSTGSSGISHRNLGGCRNLSDHHRLNGYLGLNGLDLGLDGHSDAGSISGSTTISDAGSDLRLDGEWRCRHRLGLGEGWSGSHVRRSRFHLDRRSRRNDVDHRWHGRGDLDDRRRRLRSRRHHWCNKHRCLRNGLEGRHFDGRRLSGRSRSGHRDRRRGGARSWRLRDRR